MYVGRMTTAVLCIVGLVWIPIVDNAGDELFLYVQVMLKHFVDRTRRSLL